MAANACRTHDDMTDGGKCPNASWYLTAYTAFVLTFKIGFILGEARTKRLQLVHVTWRSCFPSPTQQGRRHAAGHSHVKTGQRSTVKLAKSIILSA